MRQGKKEGTRGGPPRPEKRSSENGGGTAARLLRAALWTAFILAAALSAGIAIRGFAGSLARQLPREGFLEFLDGKDIFALAFRGNEVWAGGTDGLYRITGSGGSASGGIASGGIASGGSAGDGQTAPGRFNESEIGDFEQVRAVLATEDGIWVGHEDGLSFVDAGSGTITTLTDRNGLPDLRVNALCSDADGRIWAGTWGGAAIIENGRITRVMDASDGLNDDMVNVISRMSDGSMWLGSYVAPRGGVTVISGGDIQTFSTQNGLLHANINAIMEPCKNVVLAGGGLYTKGGGSLFRKVGGAWSAAGSVVKTDGLAGEKIRSQFLDSAGNLWAGSEYDGLAVFFRFSVTAAGSAEYSGRKVLTRENALPNDEVKAIGESPDGAVWIGTRSGLLRIEKGGIENVR